MLANFSAKIARRRPPKRPNWYEYDAATIKAPAIPLPKITGIKFLVMTVPNVTGAPNIKAKGRTKKFAMECSNPIPTKVLMGNQQPTIFPVMSLAAPERKTAILTIQLHMIALMRVGTNAALVLAMAVLMVNDVAPGFITPEAMAMAAKSVHPTMFPANEMVQLVQRSFQETKPSNLAAATVAELLVNNCPDVDTINNRLTGKRAAKAILAIPGLAADRPPKLPAIANEISPPKPT